MKQNNCIYFLGCLVALCGLPTLCNGESLQQLLNGSSLSIGNLSFTNWGLGPIDGLVDLTKINVVGTSDGSGLTFTGGGSLTANNRGLFSLEFRYNVSATGPGIQGVSLKLDDYAFNSNTGNIAVGADLLDATSSDLGGLLTEADQGAAMFSLQDQANFAANTTLVVDNVITLGGDSQGDLVSLNQFSVRFAQVPEPSSGLLTISGVLMALHGCRRRTFQL